MKKHTLILLAILSLSACKENQQATKQLHYKNFDVVTIQPFFTRMGEMQEKEGWEIPDGFTNYNQLISGAGNILKESIPNITYKNENISKDEVISSNILSKLGKNQIILLESHGSCVRFYDNENDMHSVIWTGQDYDFDKEESDPDYYDLNLVNAEYNEAISYAFIEKYVGDLTGSLVYLGCCFSAREVTLAQTFLAKGAEAVVGNTHNTQGQYNSLIEYTTIKYLAEINPETNKTYTLYEAMCIAKEKYGKKDTEKYPSAAGSEPIIFGNPYFCLSEFIDKE